MLAGRRPVIELLRSGQGAEQVLIAQGLAPSGILGDIRKRAERAQVPVRNVPRAEVDLLARGANHQGVVAITARYRYTPLDELLDRAVGTLLFLDGIMDPHNLGALLRSADVAGFGGVVIPTRRASAVTAAVRRVSAGAAETVPVSRVGNLAQAIGRAQEKGFWVLGLDEKAAEDLWSSKLMEPPVALILGAEDRGLSKPVRDRCDALVSIPRAGRIDSLNVGVAGAVAMFEVARRSAMQETP